jgi:hypothetical protein
MWFLRPRSSRQAALAAMALSSAAALLAVIPSRAQQNQPNVRFTVPATAGRAATRIDYQFTLPAGLQLVRVPEVRVLDAKNAVAEQWPMYVLQRTPEFRGYQILQTQNYPPGRYLVRVEVPYRLPDGRQSRFVSPTVPMTVAPR